MELCFPKKDTCHYFSFHCSDTYLFLRYELGGPDDHSRYSQSRFKYWSTLIPELYQRRPVQIQILVDAQFLGYLFLPHSSIPARVHFLSHRITSRFLSNIPTFVNVLTHLKATTPHHTTPQSKARSSNKALNNLLHIPRKTARTSNKTLNNET